VEVLSGTRHFPKVFRQVSEGTLRTSRVLKISSRLRGASK
jgi:hypothetical protein